MDPAVVAALSGAPPSVVLAYIVVVLMRDRRRSEAAHLKALQRLELAIRRQSALLLVVAETMMPGRAKQIDAQLDRLFERMPASDGGDGADEASEG